MGISCSITSESDSIIVAKFLIKMRPHTLAEQSGWHAVIVSQTKPNLFIVYLL